MRKCRHLHIYILEVRQVSEKNTCGALFSIRFGYVLFLISTCSICAPGRNGSVQKVAPNSAFRQVGAVERVQVSTGKETLMGFLLLAEGANIKLNSAQPQCDHMIPHFLLGTGWNVGKGVQDDRTTDFKPLGVLLSHKNKIIH